MINFKEIRNIYDKIKLENGAEETDNFNISVHVIDDNNQDIMKCINGEDVFYFEEHIKNVESLLNAPKIIIKLLDHIAKLEKELKMCSH